MPQTSVTVPTWLTTPLLAAALLTPSLAGQSERHPLPTTADIDQADAWIDEAYAELLDTRARDKLAETAATLLEHARDEPAGTALHYRGLHRAAELAERGQEVDLGLEALDTIGRLYHLDATPLRLSFCRGIAEHDRLQTEAARAALRALSGILLNAATTADHETIDRLLPIARDLATTVDQTTVQELVEALTGRDGSRLRRPGKGSEAPASHDPETLAALAVCLCPDHWDTAALLLEHSRDPHLRAALDLERAADSRSDDPLALAAAWLTAHEESRPHPESWAWGWRALCLHRAAVESGQLRPIHRRRAENQLETLELRLGLSDRTVVRITAQPGSERDSERGTPRPAGAPRRAARRLPWDEELLENPSAEEGNDLTGWVTSQGKWKGAASVDEKIKPHAGRRFFYAGGVAFGSLYQDVDVSLFEREIAGGRVRARIEARAISLDNSRFPDRGQVRVEFLDASGNALAGDWDSGFDFRPGGWHRIGTRIEVPPKTQTIRFHLEAKRSRVPRRPRNPNNAYFDSLSLRLEKR